MLFNSFEFLFCFLPAAILGHRLLLAIGRPQLAVPFLALASLFFYGWWNLSMLPLFLASILVNFGIGLVIRRARDAGADRVATGWLWAGVSLNLGLICYYKYFGFLAETVKSLTGLAIDVPPIILPIGISFYTFIQIAYLVDHWAKPIPDSLLSRYTLFVSFFPHLIAGPILHHRDLMPQFDEPNFRRPPFSMVAAGLTMLAVGLFKKCAVADNLAPVASAFFDQASTGHPRALESWVGVLSYSMQIYFDFSGYSDMAIGLGMLFGIRLPVNFWSPYQAVNLIDFWRRWHMTLSQFLRDYLYIPLGGNRHGQILRYRNLFLTMLLGGLWHGANWTFVIWGALHGAFLAINHLFEQILPGKRRDFGIVGTITGRAGTFLFVCLAWVFFRAESAPAAVRVLASLVGEFGSGAPKKATFAAWMKAAEIDPAQLALLVGALLVAHFAPNSATLFLRLKMESNGRIVPREDRASMFAFRPTWGWALATAAIFLAALWFSPEVSEFIYFQF